MFFDLPTKIARYSAKKAKAVIGPVILSYPKWVQCNICGWEGRRFLSDSWHKHVNCPRCSSGVRQRLFFAALQNIEELSFDNLIRTKRILHFAPEEIVTLNIRKKAAYYATADLFRQEFEFQLDMSSMPEISNESFDIVIAFDVLEHVPNYQSALEEVHRILSPQGLGIFTVPQKDDLLVTYDDADIVTPEDRVKHYGQWDHLRIFGNDFSQTVERKGFAVTAINESSFSEDVNRRNVLLPPLLSKHPLATNFRKIFFCEKTSP